MTEVGWATNVYLSESKSLKDYKTVGRPVAGVEIKGNSSFLRRH